MYSYLVWSSPCLSLLKIADFRFNKVFTYPTCELHMYRYLVRHSYCAALPSGYAQTKYKSFRAWSRARLISLILGHKCGLCPRTAGPFKTGFSLIGHAAVTLTRLLPSQLIREVEQSRSLTSQLHSTSQTENKMHFHRKTQKNYCLHFTTACSW